jgi:hypothetical protein
MADHPIPLPHDPRHQRVVDLWLGGMLPADAYLAAGYKCARKSAEANFHRIKTRPDVAAYITAIQAKAAEGAVMDAREKREFFARVKRTAITDIDLDTGKNCDLIKSYSKTESELSNSFRLEKLDPLAAIKLDNDLAGEGNPEADAMSKLATAIAGLGSNDPLPTGQM